MARRLTFPCERRASPLFGSVSRPVVLVALWSQKIQGWVRVVALVDTGADYTLLPHHYARHLGIRLDRDAQVFDTMGVGGRARVYVVRHWPMQLGHWRREIPLGFVTRDDLPPLFGRHACLETFKLTLDRHRTTFTNRERDLFLVALGP